MMTSDQIANLVASALDRQIQDPLYGNVALDDDGTNPSVVPYTVPVTIEGQSETVYAYYSPFIDATKLADNTRVLLKYGRDGQLMITDADDVAARESYSVPPTHNFVLMQHTHANPDGGGQLNASDVFNAGTVPVARGGTNIGSYTTGDLIYASASGVLSKLADIATGNALISGGVGAAPAYGKIGLTTHVSGTLPIANGGTNITTYTTGDLLYASATNVLSKLAGVATGNALISGGVATAFSWGKIGLTTHVSGTLPVANGGTGAVSFTANVVLLGNGTGALQEVAPGSSGNVLTSNGTTWTSAAPSGSSPFTTTSNVIHQNTLTDAVAFGANTNNDAKVYILGDDANEKTFRVRAASAQADNVVLIESDGGTTAYFIIGSTGALTQDGGAYTFNSAGADFDGLFKGSTDDDLLKIDAGLDMVGISEATPSSLLHIGASTTGRGSLGITEGAAPTGGALVDGTQWLDSTQKAYYRRINGLSHPGVEGMFYKTDTTSIVNSAAETSIVGTISGSSNTLPANWWKVGKTVKWVVGGTYSVASGTPTTTIRLKYSTVVLAALTSAALSFSGSWIAIASSTCRSVGASGTVETVMTFIIGGTPFVVTTLATIDTTSSLALTVTLQNSSSSNFTTTGTNLDVDMKN